MPSRIWFLGMTLAWAGPAGAQDPGDAPAFVAAVEQAPVALSNPAEVPGEWLLAFVDIETTGLVPGYHEPIDIGIAITDIDGHLLDSLFIRINPRRPELLSDGAFQSNAFDKARWQALGALEPATAVDSIASFHRSVAGDRPVLMVAFNSWFDTAFLDHLFRAEGRTWREMYHYFVLDLPSMAWSLGYRELRGDLLAGRLGVEDEPHVAEEHTGITGAMLNARIYAALIERSRTER